MMTICRAFLVLISLGGMVHLAGCGSNPPPPTPPTGIPGPSSIPSLPSPAGMPSPLPGPSLPSPSLPGPPSLPSPGLPSPQPSSIPSSLPTPDLSLPKPGSRSSTSKGKQSKGREQAARDLERAAKRVVDAGGLLGGKSKGQSGTKERDPLIPSGDNESIPEIFADIDAEPVEANTVPSTPGEDVLSDEIAAAQEALEEAGIALQTASGSVANASNDEEIAAAEGALAKARIAVIVAEQDLIDVKSILIEHGDEDLAGIITETEEALREANVAIVVATGTILEGMPELSGMPDGAGAEEGVAGPVRKGGKIGQLDDELNEALVIYDAEILAARRVLTDTTSPPLPEPADGDLILGGDDETINDPDASVEQQGRMPETDAGPGEIDIAAASIVPEDIPDAQGDDIVAKQLREAAIAESDAALKAKLWEEYRRYRAGI